ncbi:MAG: Peptide/nickel transport system permease protein [Frankiales bacterium]|jgi:ABC-type dipeptide/oligopeptide/nickel transport system permease subunit|nr:Peptide/nickel transport system permease protein [Frankiales bacterium]
MSVAQFEAVESSAVSPQEAAGGLGRDALRRLRRSPTAIVGAVLVTLFVLVAVFAPLLAPYEPNFQRLDLIRPGVYPGPSSEFLLGLDQLGRDELSRIIYGARYSLLIGVVSLTLGAAVGIALGLLAGAFGGWVDSLVMRIVDVMLAIPSLLLAIGVAALLGRSITSVMIAIAVVNVPIFARLLRGSMLAQRRSDYALAARSLGVPRSRIVLQHVLPNSLSPVIVQGTLALATAIIEAAGLAYLGLGSADPSIPEWGRMLADTQNSLATAPLLALWPGLAIVLSVMGFYLLGEALREALDPKLRR